MAEKKTSSSARKSTTRKGGAAKRGASKTSASKSSGSTASASKRSSASKGSSASKSSGNSRGNSAARAEARPATRASKVAALAAGELLELTGKAAEGVTGLERTDDGWTVQIEVCEVRRIPDTTDVLALYEVSTDAHGAMLGYRRVRRYARGTAGEQ